MYGARPGHSQKQLTQTLIVFAVKISSTDYNPWLRKAKGIELSYVVTRPLENCSLILTMTSDASLESTMTWVRDKMFDVCSSLDRNLTLVAAVDSTPEVIDGRHPLKRFIKAGIMHPTTESLDGWQPSTGNLRKAITLGPMMRPCVLKLPLLKSVLSRVVRNWRNPS